MRTLSRYISSARLRDSCLKQFPGRLRMHPSPVIAVVTDFFRRTTLHGFKYLCSRYAYDRLIWVVFCCASACSAGVLCAVLWGRFLQRPAIVALRDLQELPGHTEGMPLVIVCPSAHLIADQIVAQFKQVANKSRLSQALKHVIRKKIVHEDQLHLLDMHLDDLGLALPQALMRYSPECHDVIISCRWQNNFLPCRKLFRKQFSDWGLCCVLDPVRLEGKTTHRLFDRLQTTRSLDLALTCGNNSDSVYGCELLTVYEGEEDLEPRMLHRGMAYWKQVTFTTTEDDGSLLDVKDGCVPDKGYSRIQCIDKCLENKCGCADPLQAAASRRRDLPMCRAAELYCLHDTLHADLSSCNYCLPSCRKFTTNIVIDTSNLDLIKYSFDPFYKGLNSSIVNVVHIRVRLQQSKTFFLLPTETWLTLLSSLGGVFNMFLGVGLFSALELLFLLIFKLPLALKKSAEMTVPTVPEHHYH